MHAASSPAHKPLVVLHAATAMQVIRAATCVGDSGECVEAESQVGMATTSSGSLTGPGFWQPWGGRIEGHSHRPLAYGLSMSACRLHVPPLSLAQAPRIDHRATPWDLAKENIRL